ncbi:MAG TPA: LysM peptidoglycan-binding domain-containing protein [Candidatus Sulfomarinibacteraceae bacterium]|nr:LysM peptidoglycan-binding domain-containing protein [Candidatus Sulfomarinibacteraceae bacterium]
MPTLTACGPPAGWVAHTVLSGEARFRIALRHGVTTAQLQLASCLSTTIYAGQTLFVPCVAPPPSAAHPRAHGKRHVTGDHDDIASIYLHLSAMRPGQP